MVTKSVCGDPNDFFSAGDSAISDMFGLGLPRGSLLGNQSTIGSSSYRNYQYSNYDQTQGSLQHEVNYTRGFMRFLFQCKNFGFLMKSLKITKNLFLLRHVRQRTFE